MPNSAIWWPVNLMVTEAPVVWVHLKLPSEALGQLPEQAFQPVENWSCPTPVPWLVSSIEYVESAAWATCGITASPARLNANMTSSATKFRFFTRALLDVSRTNA